MGTAVNWKVQDLFKTFTLKNFAVKKNSLPVKMG